MSNGIQEKAVEEFIRGRRHSTERLILVIIISLLVGGGAGYTISIQVQNIQNSYNVVNQTTFNTESLPQWVQEKLQILSQIQAERDSYKTQLDIANQKNNQLQNELDTSIISLSGNVKTTFGTVPIFINFEDGSGKYTFKINNGAYSANLQKEIAYTVTVDYTSVGIPSITPCIPSSNKINLQASDKTQKIQYHDWECK